MSKSNSWQHRLQELADRSWDVETIRKRLKNLRQKGFFSRDLDCVVLQKGRTGYHYVS